MPPAPTPTSPAPAEDRLAAAAAAALAAAEASAFSGAVRIDVGGDSWSSAFGLADRAHGVANTTATRFAIASGTKLLTALVVLRLVEDGVLALDAPVRRWLGADLPLVDDRVTVEHLLSHRSGIGDYLDEDDGGSINDHVLRVPVHQLDSAEAYLAVLEGHPQRCAPGEEQRYCNGGYVVLALVAERATGRPIWDLTAALVCGPADLQQTGVVPADARPGDLAVGYLAAEGLTSNVLHLPLVGLGDGGAVSTLDDVHRLWSALLAGRIVSTATVAAMATPRGTTADGLCGGLGLWLSPAGGALAVEGYDAGISFRSEHHPEEGWTHTTVANWSDGAWPVTRAVAASLT